MKKKTENKLIWVFLVLSLLLSILFIIDVYNNISQIEDLEGIYYVHCPNGSIFYFNRTEPKFLCGLMSAPNPFLNDNNSIINSDYDDIFKNYEKWENQVK